MSIVASLLLLVVEEVWLAGEEKKVVIGGWKRRRFVVSAVTLRGVQRDDIFCLRKECGVFSGVCIYVFCSILWSVGRCMQERSGECAEEERKKERKKDEVGKRDAQTRGSRASEPILPFRDS